VLGGGEFEKVGVSPTFLFSVSGYNGGVLFRLQEDGCWLETFTLWAFGVSWFVNGETLRRDQEG
jgi:hypothetical protein